MKKVNAMYWIVTAIFGAFMAFSAIPDILSVPDAVKMVNGGLGYPVYIIPFLGVAKLLGVIAILVSGFPRLKEWHMPGCSLTWQELPVQVLQPEVFSRKYCL